MQGDRVRIAKERLAELLAIYTNKDLSKEQRDILIGKKMEEYRQKAAADRAAEADSAESTAKPSYEELSRRFRESFERGLNEGTCHITPFPSDEEYDEIMKKKGK